MRAILSFEYNPERPEDVERMLDMQKVGGYKMALWDLNQHLREKLKYAELPKEQYALYEELREQFNEILNYHNVTLE